MIDPCSGRSRRPTALRMAGLATLLMPAFLFPAAPALACHDYVSPGDGASGCGAYRRDRANGSYKDSTSTGGSGSGSGLGSAGSGSSGPSGTGNACS